MPIFDHLIGSPDIDELKARNNIDGLIQALSYRETYIRWSAVAALGELARDIKSTGHFSRILDWFTKLALDSLENKTTRYNTIKATGQIGARLEDAPMIARSIDLLKGTLVDVDSDIRLVTAEALEQIAKHIMEGDMIKWVIDPLLLALEEPNQKVREVIIDTLSEIGTPAIPQLLHTLRYNNFKLRDGALECLDHIGWRPDKDEDGAAYWIVRNRWNQCVEIGDPAIRPLINALHFENVLSRQGAADALGQIGEAAITALLPILYDEDKDVRLAAAEALAKTGWTPRIDDTGALYWIARQGWTQCAEIGAPAVGPLLFMLKDRDISIQRGIFWTMGQIGAHLEDRAQLIRVLQSLAAALASDNERLRQAAVESLGTAGAQLKDSSQRNRTVIAPLLKALQDKNGDVRSIAADGLDKLGWKPDRGLNGVYYWIARQQWDRCVELGRGAVTPLVASLEDYLQNARQGAAATLERLDWKPERGRGAAAYWVVKSEWEKCVIIGDEAVEPLIAALRLRWTDDHQAIGNALGQIGAQTKQAALRLHIIEALSGVLKDDDLRLASVRALGQIAGRKQYLDAIVESLITALKYEDARESISEELVKIGLPAVERLIPALKDHYLQESAEKIIARVGSPAVPQLIAVLKDEELGEAAVDVLDRLGWKPDKSEAGAAYWIVKRKWERVAEIGAPAVDQLIQILNESTSEMRQSAAGALGDIGDPRALGPLLAALRARNYGVRRRAVGALERMHWQPENNETGAAYWVVKRDWERCAAIGPPALSPLLAALEESEEQVRLAAVETLGRIGDPRAIAPLTDMLRTKGMSHAATQALREISRKRVVR